MKLKWLFFMLPRLLNHRHVLDDLIDEAIFGRFFGRHKAVAVGVFLDLVERMASVLQQNLIHLLLDPLELLGVDRDFLGRALHTG